MNRSLVWFRNDLRIFDHEPLRRAIEASATQGGSGPGAVVCLYCFDERQWANTSFGFPKTGVHRTRFLRESVEDLREQIRGLGGELIVRHGRCEEVIGDLIQDLSISSVFYHQEIGTEERRIERSVQAVCQKASIPSQSDHGVTLFHPGELPFSIVELPELFTHFRKQVEKSSTHRAPLPAPTMIPCQLPVDFSVGSIPSAEALFGDDFVASGNVAKMSDIGRRQYTGGETAGLDRLDEYFWRNDRLRVYKVTRNGMLNVDDSSKLSLWLANGCLSPRTIAAEVKRYEDERLANQSTYWMSFELLWRDYFHFIAAKHGSRLFQVGGIQERRLPWGKDVGLFNAWKEGQTGYPLVDANMRELAATGYMSNRGRQNVGSFLCKNLGIDWRMGAEWFESQLIDYAPASNYGNWNYVAGVGNDARGFRFFNITKQSRDYDEDGSYVRYWLPELSHVTTCKVHEPWTMTTHQQSSFNVIIGHDYPAPIVDLFASAKDNEQKYHEFDRNEST